MNRLRKLWERQCSEDSKLLRRKWEVRRAAEIGAGERRDVLMKIFLHRNEVSNRMKRIKLDGES